MMWFIHCLLMLSILIPTLGNNDTVTLYNNGTLTLYNNGTLTLYSNDMVKCESGEEGDCSKCYKVLASNVVHNDRNMFRIQNTFFPPEEESPVFVIVTYEYKDNSSITESEIWFWSTSTFYIFQPLHVFQFTSLFFSDTQLVTSKVKLTLPLECFNADEEHKTLLTQRVSLILGSKNDMGSTDLYGPTARARARARGELGLGLALGLGLGLDGLCSYFYLLYSILLFSNFLPIILFMLAIILFSHLLFQNYAMSYKFDVQKTNMKTLSEADGC